METHHLDCHLDELSAMPTGVCMSFLKGDPHKLPNKFSKKEGISKFAATYLKAILNDRIYYLFAYPFGSR